MSAASDWLLFEVDGDAPPGCAMRKFALDDVPDGPVVRVRVMHDTEATPPRLYGYARFQPMQGLWLLLIRTGAGEWGVHGLHVGDVYMSPNGLAVGDLADRLEAEAQAAVADARR